jgi:hypothetical protein
VLIALCLVLLCSFASAETLPVSPYNDIEMENPHISLNITEITQSDDYVSLSMESILGPSLVLYSFSAVFLLEKYENGAWRSIPYSLGNNASFEYDELDTSTTGAVTSFKTYPTKYYEMPGAGHYRIVKEFTIISRSDYRERIDEPFLEGVPCTVYAAAEFDFDPADFE